MWATAHPPPSPQHTWVLCRCRSTPTCRASGLCVLSQSYSRLAGVGFLVAVMRAAAEMNGGHGSPPPAVSFSKTQKKPQDRTLGGRIVPRECLGRSHCPRKYGHSPRSLSQPFHWAPLGFLQFALCPAKPPRLILGFSPSPGPPVTWSRPLRAMHLALGCDSVPVSKSGEFSPVIFSNKWLQFSLS